MRKARYPGAHTAKAETGGPVKKATPHQEKPGEGLPLFRRAREKDRGTLPREERVFSPETEGAERQAALSRGNTGRMPKTAPERTGRIAQPATEETVRTSLSRTGHIRVETPVFPTRERRRPSRRLIFFLSAVAAALLLAVVAFALRRPIDEGVYETSMAKAVEAYENADLDNALRFLRRAAAVEETDECLKLMARCYEQTGMLDKALADAAKDPKRQDQIMAAEANKIAGRRERNEFYEKAPEAPQAQSGDAQKNKEPSARERLGEYFNI